MLPVVVVPAKAINKNRYRLIRDKFFTGGDRNKSRQCDLYL